MSKTGLVLVVLLGLCASEMLRGPKVMIEEEQSIFETEQEDQSYYIPNMQGSEMDITLQSDANGIDTSLAVFQEEKDPFVEIQEANQVEDDAQYNFEYKPEHNVETQEIAVDDEQITQNVSLVVDQENTTQQTNNEDIAVQDDEFLRYDDYEEQQNDNEPQAVEEEVQAIVEDEPQVEEVQAVEEVPQADEPQAVDDELYETQESAEIAAIPTEEPKMNPNEPYHFKQPRQFQDEQQFEDSDIVAPKKGPEVVLKLHPAEESAKPLQPPQTPRKHIYIYNPLAKKPFVGIKFPPMKVTKEVNYLGSFDMSNMKLPVWSGESNHRLDDELEFFQFIRTSDISLNEY